MHRWLRFGLTVIGLVAVAACNTVLGIEQAELDQDIAAVAQCHWPDYRPRQDCPLCSEACSTRCKVQDCLDGDGACRNALREYRRCVGDTCSDTSRACAGCTAGNPEADAVRRCLDGCGGGCSLAGAASLCESYCACMQSRCTPDVPGASIEACVDACENGSIGISDPFMSFAVPPSPHELTCYWEHCERATPSAQLHCDHAIGHRKAELCSEAQEPSGSTCKYPKGYGNAPCNKDEDCCSTCRLDLGVCAAP
jgi:hypothetical protein